MNPNHLFVIRDKSSFLWIKINQNVWQLKAKNRLNLLVIQKPKSILSDILLKKSYTDMI